jgi:hypothetical protein
LDCDQASRHDFSSRAERATKVKWALGPAILFSAIYSLAAAKAGIVFGPMRHDLSRALTLLHIPTAILQEAQSDWDFAGGSSGSGYPSMREAKEKPRICGAFLFLMTDAFPY